MRVLHDSLFHEIFNFTCTHVSLHIIKKKLKLHVIRKFNTKKKKEEIQG